VATITKRKHGYCVQIRRKGYAAVSRTFPSHAEATAWANREDARRTSSRPAGTIGDLKRTTLRDILERYLAEVSPRNRGHEIECYQLAKVLRAPVADMSLQSLSANALAMYRDERLKEVSAGTVCRELHHIQHAISIAMREWGYIQCKYGSKALPLSKDGSAVFAKLLSDAPTAPQAIYAARALGELYAEINRWSLFARALRH
jgi:hypothetical protein